MRIIVMLAVMTMLVVHARAGDVRHAALPESFWGRWAPGEQVCENADRSVIVLAGKTYVSSDANCTIDWVSETAAARGPNYAAHLQCAKSSAPIQRAISNLIIRAEDNNKISVGPDFSRLVVYQRCAANAPAVAR